MNSKWFYFDEMLTPSLITFIYWLLLLSSLFNGLNVMFDEGLSFSSFIFGIFLAALGALGARIWCEILIVLFKMNEALQELRPKE